MLPLVGARTELLARDAFTFGILYLWPLLSCAKPGVAIAGYFYEALSPHTPLNSAERILMMS
jgi:hypothetical protein